MTTGNLPFSRRSNCASSKAARASTSVRNVSLSMVCPSSADSNMSFPWLKSPHRHWIAANAASPAVSVRRMRGPRRKARKPAARAVSISSGARPPSAPISSSTRTPGAGRPTFDQRLRGARRQHQSQDVVIGRSGRRSQPVGQFPELGDFRHAVAPALFARRDDHPAPMIDTALRARAFEVRTTLRFEATGARCAWRPARRPSGWSCPFSRRTAEPAPASLGPAPRIRRRARPRRRRAPAADRPPRCARRTRRHVCRTASVRPRRVDAGRGTRGAPRLRADRSTPRRKVARGRKTGA